MQKNKLIAVLFPVVIAACFTDWSCRNQQPERHLLEFGYNTKIDDSTKETASAKGYTIDAVYVEGKDTVSVKGITQAQYDSLHIVE